MDGTADYILDLACRIFAAFLHGEGVASGVVDGVPLESYAEFPDLFFAEAIHRPICSRW